MAQRHSKHVSKDSSILILICNAEALFYKHCPPFLNLHEADGEVSLEKTNWRHNLEVKHLMIKNDDMKTLRNVELKQTYRED